jgi:hypothetical protein
MICEERALAEGAIAVSCPEIPARPDELDKTGFSCRLADHMPIRDRRNQPRAIEFAADESCHEQAK